MNNLFDTITVKNTKIKNRIGVPAMVCFDWTSDNGIPTKKSVEHYHSLAKGGAGLIVTEACAVNPFGRVSNCQIGLWNNDQMQGLKSVIDAVHTENIPIIIQIQHSGLVGYGDLTPPQNYLPDTLKAFTSKNSDTILTPAPSDYSCIFPFDNLKRKGHEMSTTEVISLENDFVDSCIRAYKAGADGVELHACHFYVISQFMNKRINKRTDIYGSPEVFCTNIIKRVRENTDDNFIIGVRLGIFEPTLADGIAHAKVLESHGADYLHMSFGFATDSEPEKPESYEFNEFIYGAEEIKKNVSIPVFAVNDINTPELAKNIVSSTDLDMVFVGRNFLVDYNWANHAKNNEPAGSCLNCSYCWWRAFPEKCGGKIVFERKNKA